MRLELGHQLEPTEVRTTEFARAVPEAQAQQPPSSGSGKPAVAAPWKAGRFSGQDFALQPDGTLRCPAHQALVAHEQRREADGSLRVVYAASIRSCRPCPLRHHCQWEGSATKKPRQVSVLLHPLPVGPAPLRLSRLEPQSAPARLHAARATPTHRGEPATSRRNFARQSGGDSFPRATCPLSPLVGRAARSQRASPNSEPGDHQTVRRDIRLCHLARFGESLISS
ncbi:MAG: hypothetical protein AUH94_03475 [Ktedonobacter sp. 13_2_20CM_2_54_8]|nr:MAG: hypothetical protein AUH94_03475 [Ktedonobacter sp. 13_2_20CM_2_54_8]